MSALKPAQPGESALAVAVAHGEQAAGVGFDWPDALGVLDKVREELGELEEALGASGGRADAAVHHELGDLLLALTSLARALKVDAEGALRAADDRFVARFTTMEALAAARGASLDGMDAGALDALWREAKARLAAPFPSRGGD